MPLLSLADVTITAADRILISGLNWQCFVGQRWALLGANGRGKSTLLRTVAGLLESQAGTIDWAGQSMAKRGPRAMARLRALVEQTQQDAFAQSVREHVALSLRPYQHAWQFDTKDDLAVAGALQAMGLESLAERDIRSLSGGERQRVALAAALAQQTPALLLDEPIAHLDPAQQSHVLAALARQHQKLIVMALHDPNLAMQWCTHVLMLLPDGWHAGPISDLMNTDRLARLYGGNPEILAIPGKQRADSGFTVGERLIRWR